MTTHRTLNYEFSSGNPLAEGSAAAATVWRRLLTCEAGARAARKGEGKRGLDHRPGTVVLQDDRGAGKGLIST